MGFLLLEVQRESLHEPDDVEKLSGLGLGEGDGTGIGFSRFGSPSQGVLEWGEELGYIGKALCSKIAEWGMVGHG